MDVSGVVLGSARPIAGEFAPRPLRPVRDIAAGTRPWRSRSAIHSALRITLPPGNGLDALRIGQEHPHRGVLQDIPHRFPVRARGLHRHGLAAGDREPIPHRGQFGGAVGSDRLGAVVPQTDPPTLLPPIAAGAPIPGDLHRRPPPAAPCVVCRRLTHVVTARGGLHNGWCPPRGAGPTGPRARRPHRRHDPRKAQGPDAPARLFIPDGGPPGPWRTVPRLSAVSHDPCPPLVHAVGW